MNIICFYKRHASKFLAFCLILNFLIISGLLTPQTVSAATETIYIPQSNFGQLAADASGLAAGVLRSGVAGDRGVTSFVNSAASYWSGNGSGVSSVASARATFMRLQIPAGINLSMVTGIKLEFTIETRHNGSDRTHTLFDLNKALPSTVSSMTAQGSAATAVKSQYAYKSEAATSNTVSSSAGQGTKLTFDLTSYLQRNPDLRTYEFIMLASADMLSLYDAEASSQANRPKLIIDYLEAGSAPADWNPTAIEFALEGQNTVNNVKIAWPLANGADRYEVYRDGTLIGSTKGDIIDDYGLAVDVNYTYTVKAIRNNAVLFEGTTNMVSTFSYVPNPSRTKDNITMQGNLGDPNAAYGVKVGDTWYNFRYENGVPHPDTVNKPNVRVTTLQYQMSSDGKNYGSWNNIYPVFEGLRVEGQGWRQHPVTGDIVFAAHAEGNATTGYNMAKLFVATFSPGRSGSSAANDNSKNRFMVSDANTTTVYEQYAEISNPDADELSSYFIGRPKDGSGNFLDSRDMVLFSDDVSNNNNAYIFSAVRMNSNTGIFKLDSNWRRPVTYIREEFTGKHKESPSVTKVNGTYVFFGSSANGWYPTQAEYATTSNIESAWSPLKPITNATAFGVQANSSGHWYPGANGRSVLIGQGNLWGPQFPSGYQVEGGTRTWPVAVNGLTATAGWFSRLNFDDSHGLIPVQGGQLVSLNKPTTSSQSGLDASIATDGAAFNTNARIAHSSLPYTITIDLQQPTRLTEIAFTTRLTGGSDTVLRYRIEASTNGSGWTQIVDGSQNNYPGFVVNRINNTTQFRYVRLVVTNLINVHNNQSGSNMIWADGIYEISVYGTPQGSALPGDLTETVYIPQDNFGQLATDAAGLVTGVLRSGFAGTRTGSGFQSDASSYWSGDNTGNGVVASSRATFMRLQIPNNIDPSKITSAILEFTVETRHNGSDRTHTLFDLNNALPANVSSMTTQGSAASAVKSQYTCKSIAAVSNIVSGTAGQGTKLTFDLTGYITANPTLRTLEFEMLASADMLSLYDTNASASANRPKLTIQYTN